MLVQCDSCSLEYDLDAQRLAKGALVVKCVNCDHVFRVVATPEELAADLAEQEAEQAAAELAEQEAEQAAAAKERANASEAGKEKPDAAVPRAVSLPPGPDDDVDKKGDDDADRAPRRAWLVRQGDEEPRTCYELTTLQKWIFAGLVTRSWDISLDGENWKPLGAIDELEPFFDFADEAHGSWTLAGSGPVLAPEPSTEPTDLFTKKPRARTELSAVPPPPPKQAADEAGWMLTEDELVFEELHPEFVADTAPISVVPPATAKPKPKPKPTPRAKTAPPPIPQDGWGIEDLTAEADGIDNAGNILLSSREIVLLDDEGKPMGPADDQLPDAPKLPPPSVKPKPGEEVVELKRRKRPTTAPPNEPRRKRTSTYPPAAPLRRKRLSTKPPGMGPERAKRASSVPPLPARQRRPSTTPPPKYDSVRGIDPLDDPPAASSRRRATTERSRGGGGVWIALVLVLLVGGGVAFFALRGNKKERAKQAAVTIDAGVVMAKPAEAPATPNQPTIDAGVAAALPPDAATAAPAKATKSKPDRPPARADYRALIRKGDALAQSGRCSKAVSLYQAALKQKPGDAGAKTGMGYCHVEAGRYASAHAEFSGALRSRSGHQDAMLGIAEVYKRQGKLARAIASYQQFLARHPSGGNANIARRQLAALEAKRRAKTPKPAAKPDASVKSPPPAKPAGGGAKPAPADDPSDSDETPAGDGS